MAATTINLMERNKMATMRGWGETKMAAVPINPMGGNKMAAMGGWGEPRWRLWP